MLQSELDGKRVVVALGGNALGDAPGDQLKLLEGASKNLARMVKEGINVVVTHGNGPQVGIIDEAFEVASKDKDAQVPPMPLSDCNAMSQGYIGAQLSCALRNEFRRQDIMREVANVPTHVVVDADDPAFKDYEKPIGAFMTETEAHAFAKATGYQVREDSGRGWRRVVPSPVPQDIVELETVRDLMEDGCVVIAAGGGGIPVTVRDGVHTAVDAIVDKDLTSAILAWRVRADILVILTAVEKVYLDFGKPTQKALDAMTVSEARAYMEQGQFAPGSMLPKVQACVKFVEAHPGGRAVITSLDHAAAGLRGETGTLIVADEKQRLLLRLPYLGVVGQHGREALADGDVVVGVQVRQRYAHRPFRGVEAVAVHEHDAGVLGESHHDVQRVVVFLQPREEVGTVQARGPDTQVDHRVVAGALGVGLKRPAEALPQKAQTVLHELLHLRAVCVVIVQQAVQREQRHHHLLGRAESRRAV